MKIFFTVIFLLVISIEICAIAADQQHADQIAKHRAAFTNNDRGEEGVKFACTVAQLEQIDKQLSDYLTQLDIQPALIKRSLKPETETLLFTLNTPPTDSSTLDFRFRPELEIKEQLITLSSANKKKRTVLTVSEKEIVLALMQHGRLTEFNGDNCSAEAFIDHVKIRQNTVAWAERLYWIWPDGERAKWNKKYWSKGTPLPGIAPWEAIGDAFENQSKYGIGCYTATKLVMLQGVLDYYRRIKKAPSELFKVEQRLLVDDEPLVDIEPRALWAFEGDFDVSELWKNGELFEMSYNIPSQNFVPGDWIYIRNTDPKTQTKVGYEGSNAIYLGRGKFDDYYNDHHHAYLFHEKLNEVYQWRHHVFNRTRDIEKLVPLTGAELKALQATPEQGGLVMDVRVFLRTSADRHH